MTHDLSDTSGQRIGNWMQTYTGGEFWPMDPRADEVNIKDIAHALSNQCRYAGHCTKFYSVAQHSVLISRALPLEFQLWGLLHDAAEAYVVDVPKPLKEFLTNYGEIEERVMNVIIERYRLSPEMPVEVKQVDTAILGDEMEQIMVSPPREWNLPLAPLGILIQPWSPEKAESNFISQYLGIQLYLDNK